MHSVKDPPDKSIDELAAAAKRSIRAAVESARTESPADWWMLAVGVAAGISLTCFAVALLLALGIMR